MTRNRRRCLAFLALPAALASAGLRAQDVEPRSYWNVPLGLNFLITGLAHSSGGLSTDPSVPLTDAHLRINGGVLAYSRGFDWWGDSGRLDIVLPYARLSGTATLAGQTVARDVDGLLDPRLRASINFYGAPALGLRDFAAYRQDLVIGASVQVTLPFGQYDDQRAVNLGTNRFSIRPELGMSKAFGAWSDDTAAAVNVYEHNDSYFGGHSLHQAPIYSFQASLSRSFDGGLWAAVGATYYRGGRTTLDGVQRDDAMSSSRVGVTVSVPIGRANSIKFNASTGVSVRTGTDFDTFGVFWQYRWVSP